MRDKSPIVTLYDRITRTFSKIDENLIESDISKFIRITTGQFSTPKADFSKREIVLNESFISFLWCLTYIFYDIAQNKVRIAKQVSSTFRTINGSDPEVKQLDSLFDWAFSLKSNNPVEWPDGLPKPTIDSIKVQITNIIFIDSISYIMCHEVAHMLGAHWENYKPIKIKLDNPFSDPLTEEEQMISKALEQEADVYAFDKVIASCQDDDSRYHKFLSMVIAELASLFAIPKKASIKSSTHPSSHIRIFNTRLRASFNEGEEFWLDQIMNVGLSLFCRLHGIHYEDKGFQTDNEILDYFFDLLEINGYSKLQY